MAPIGAGRAPFLLLLLPFAGGVAAAEGLRAPVPASAAVAAALALAAAVCAAKEYRWLVLACGSALCSGLAAGAAARPSAVGWRGLPVREATVLVRIERVFPGSRRFDSCAGFALILEAPRHLGIAAGVRLAFAVGPDPRADEVVPGAACRLRGLWRPLADQARAESFDAHCIAAGAAFSLRRASVVEVRSPSAWGRWCLAAARHAETILRSGCDTTPQEVGVYTGMFLGRSSLLDPRDRALFRRTGTTHLFAVSGMHIAVIAGSLLAALRLARVPRFPAAFAALALVFVFVGATGSSVSAWRAFLAVAFLVAGQALRERTGALAGWSFAAFGVLVSDPRQLFLPGFQLSYLVVLALVTYAAPLAVWSAGLGSGRRFVPDDPRRRRHLLRLTAPAAASLAAFLVSTPVVASLTGLVTPGSILANLALVPLASLALVAALCALGAGGLGLPPDLFNLAGCALVACMRAAARVVDALPGSSLSVVVRWPEGLGWATAAVVAALLAGTARAWRPRVWFLAPPLVLLAVLPLALARTNPQLMKSAYELAMERLRATEGESKPLTDAQKRELADIDARYRAKIAEREIFLQARLAEAETSRDFGAVEDIRRQIASERARLEEEREAEKERVRRSG